jgi:carbon-monoxide dehydrogenase medium subunit
VRLGYPILFVTARVIADPLVRNRATIGGNIAHAVPANDHPATMLAVGATIVARGAHRTREIAADDFFTRFLTTGLDEGEIITRIRVPTPWKRAGSTYLKSERNVGDCAIAAVAVNLEVDESGKCTSARIGLTNVSDVPMRARNAEVSLIGYAVTANAIDSASREVAAVCDPKADLRGPVEYKRDLVRVLGGRAIGRAVARARGGTH